jgi:hypothetical protein
MKNDSDKHAAILQQKPAALSVGGQTGLFSFGLRYEDRESFSIPGALKSGYRLSRLAWVAPRWREHVANTKMIMATRAQSQTSESANHSASCRIAYRPRSNGRDVKTW